MVETQEPQPRRVIQETTAATMRQMLEGVVLNGTGKAGTARWVHRAGREDGHGAKIRCHHWATTPRTI